MSKSSFRLHQRHSMATRSWPEAALAEIKNALYWSMLAATTVGPGTVVVASKVRVRGDTHRLLLRHHRRRPHQLRPFSWSFVCIPLSSILRHCSSPSPSASSYCLVASPPRVAVAAATTSPNLSCCASSILHYTLHHITLSRTSATKL